MRRFISAPRSMSCPRATATEMRWLYHSLELAQARRRSGRKPASQSDPPTAKRSRRAGGHRHESGSGSSDRGSDGGAIRRDSSDAGTLRSRECPAAGLGPKSSRSTEPNTDSAVILQRFGKCAIRSSGRRVSRRRAKSTMDASRAQEASGWIDVYSCAATMSTASR